MKYLLLPTILLSNFLFAQTEVSFTSNSILTNFVNSEPTLAVEHHDDKDEFVKYLEGSDSKKITYKDHLHEAESFDIPLILNNEQMDSLILANHLIPVPEEGKGYNIQKLTHSRPYLNETTYKILQEISSQFFQETNLELSISSLTRTLENQNKLRRINSNAAKGDSSHNYGASFDISYSKYGDKVGRSAANERILLSILKEFEADGKIYFIKEFRQPCFHITVRNFNPKTISVVKK